MAMKKIWTLPAVGAALMLALSGCVAVDHTPVSAPKTEAAAETQEEPVEDTETEDTTGDGPADDDTQTEASEPTSDPSDGGGESQAPEVEQVDLSPENGTLYLRTKAGFSPELIAWVIDTEEGMVEYHRYSCLGTTQGAGIGTLEQLESGDGDRYKVTWEGENPSPKGYSSGQTQRITVAERTLENGTDVASVHHEMEIENFAGKCKDTGEMVAGFVF